MCPAACVASVRSIAFATAVIGDDHALDGIYAGVYRGTYANREIGYEITEHDRSITLRPLDGREPQELQRAGEHRFELSKFGVIVMFAVENGKAVAFTVTQGELQVEVERVK